MVHHDSRVVACVLRMAGILSSDRRGLSLLLSHRINILPQLIQAA
jgi:hypothetical protein